MKLSHKFLAGFTAIEMMMSLGTLAIAAGVAVPIYRRYLLRSDLEIARQNIAQGLERAKFLSQVGMNDSSWGFSTDAVPGRGVLFMGESFATRNSDFDEMYSLPSNISVDGLTEVSFEKVTGAPNTTGDITLISLQGDIRSVTVQLGEDGNVSIPDDWLTICYDPYGAQQQTMQVPDSLWEIYEGRGSIIGDCSTITICGNSAVETGEACDDGNTASGDGCSATCQSEVGGDGGPVVTVDGDQDVNIDIDYSCTITVLGADLDPFGYDQMITVSNKGTTGWNEPFGDENKAVSGNVNIAGLPWTEDCGSTYASTDAFRFKAAAWTKKQLWYDGSQNNDWQKDVYIVQSGSDDNAYVLVDGDAIPNHGPLLSQTSIASYLQPYIDVNGGEIVLNSNQVLYLFELGTNVPTYSSDFQDLAILVTFSGN